MQAKNVELAAEAQQQERMKVDRYSSYKVYHVSCNLSPQLTVQCQQKKGAPCRMMRGSAVTNGQFTYFTPDFSTSLYQYERSTEKWTELLLCPYHNSELVIIDSELTTVGGWNRSHTNKLFTLRQGKWVNEYPSMITARSHPAVVSASDGDYPIVIGGSDGGWTATVELFQVKSRQWHKLTGLPQPLPRPSATVCGDQLNVIGDDGNGYSCSLQALLSSDEPITLSLALSWKPLPRLPVSDSTAATLCGQLVIIGGRQGWSPVNSIHQLVDQQWVKIGSMASLRFYCLVASPSTDTIMIVGGRGAYDSVEECATVKCN